MSTDTPTAVEGTDPELPEYVREDGHSGPRWTHVETGLQVELVRERRPAGRAMTTSTAMQPDDEAWTFGVRPDGAETPAVIYERLGGDRDGAVAYAREWLAAHADGVLEEDD